MYFYIVSRLFFVLKCRLFYFMMKRSYILRNWLRQVLLHKHVLLKTGHGFTLSHTADCSLHFFLACFGALLRPLLVCFNPKTMTNTFLRRHRLLLRINSSDGEISLSCHWEKSLLSLCFTFVLNQWCPNLFL